MSLPARLGIVIVMVLLVLLARLLEVEIGRLRRGDPGAAPAAPDSDGAQSGEPPLEPEPLALASAPATLASHPLEAAPSYTVGRHETLGTISRKLWGSARFWPALLEANRDRLSDPRSLRAGQEIRLPPDPRRER